MENLFLYQANEKIYKTHRMKEQNDSMDNSVDMSLKKTCKIRSKA
jgi:hypothetical protein